MDWYPGAQRVSIDPGLYRDGGSMLTDGPWRFVVHTTEGDTIEGAERTFEQRRMWPHFAADPTGRLRQYVPLSRAGRTLDNDAGGPETNRHACAQIELVGFADQIADLWTPDACAWLGHEFAALFAELAIVRASTSREWVDATDGFVARDDAPQRMTFGEWSTFSGVCGHQHVPENDHYDPGKWNVSAFLAAMTPPEEPDMTPAEMLAALKTPEGQSVLRTAVRAEIIGKDAALGDVLAMNKIEGDPKSKQRYGILYRLAGGIRRDEARGK